MPWSQGQDSLQDLQLLQSLREEKEGKLQMPLSPRKNGQTSLFKEVRAFKGREREKNATTITTRHDDFRAPLPAEWIFRRRFSLLAWILQGFCRELCCGFFFLWIFFPSFKGTKGPKKSKEKIHTKIHDKIHALRMKTHHDDCSAQGQSWQFHDNFVTCLSLCACGIHCQETS